MSFSRKTFIDIFGEVSPNFKIYTLEDIASNEKRSIISGPFGSNISSKYFKDEGIPVIRGNNLTEDDTKFIDDGFVFVSKEKADELNTYAKVNDLIFTAAGTIGQVGMIPKDSKFNKYIISNKQLRVTLDLNKVNHFYVYYWFSSKLINKYIKQLNTGSTIPLINLSIIKGLPIPLPNKDIQDKIVSIIDSIDQKIENCQNINKNLFEIADSIFQQKFLNFTDYSENELVYSDFGYIPKNWHYKSLDEISNVAIGKTPPRKEKEWFSEHEGIKWVSIKDLGVSGTYIFDTSEYLTPEAVKKFNVNIVPKDTVILSFKLTVGRIAITTEDMVTNEAIAHFKINKESYITKEYLYLYLKNFNYETLGSTSSIARAINSKIVKKIPILIPKKEEMLWFSKNINEIFNSIKNNQLEITKLITLRDTLLPKLMSGEIDVSEVNCDLKSLIINFIFNLLNHIFFLRGG